MTKKRAIDVWQNMPYTRLQKYKNIDVRANTRTKARQDVANNTTNELSVGDFVRVILSQLYSQVRKRVKDPDKKIVSSNVPQIYFIDIIFR